MLVWGMVSVEKLNHFPQSELFDSTNLLPSNIRCSTWCNGNCWSNSKTSTEEVWASLFWNTCFFAKKGKLVGGWTNPSGKNTCQIGSFPQIRVNLINLWNHHLADLANMVRTLKGVATWKMGEWKDAFKWYLQLFFWGVWHQAAQRFTSFTNVKRNLLQTYRPTEAEKIPKKCINYASEKSWFSSVDVLFPSILLFSKKEKLRLKRNATLQCLQPMLLGAACRDCSTKTDMVRSNDLPPISGPSCLVLFFGKLRSLVMVPWFRVCWSCVVFGLGKVWKWRWIVMFWVLWEFQGEVAHNSRCFLLQSLHIAHVNIFWCCVF